MKNKTKALKARHYLSFFLLLLVLAFAAHAFISNTVYIEDPNLEQLVREASGKDTGRIWKKDLSQLTELDASHRKIESLEGIEDLTELRALNLSHNQIEDLSPLQSLSKLESLTLIDNTINDLTPVSHLHQLNSLTIKDVPVTDQGSFLKELTHLQNLELSDSAVDEIDSAIINQLVSQKALQGEVKPEAILTKLQLDQESGFYQDDFTLSMTSSDPKAQIYYSLDGSEPTRESSIYTEPLIITKQEGDKLTIVRAKAFSEGEKESELITKSYSIGVKPSARYSLPIISLVTSPENFFSEESGIYNEANAQERGSEWERPVHMEFFESNGDLKLAQNIGVRIHGGKSRSYHQKSLRLLPDEDYDQEDQLHYDFFQGQEKMNGNGTLDKFDSLVLRNSGNDWQFTMFNDALMQSLVADLGTMDTQAYRPAVVYINGDYYGIHNIRERYDLDYLSNNYDLDDEEVTILEDHVELDDGHEEDLVHYQHMLNYIEKNGLEESSHYQQIQEWMDVDNFRDYYAVQIYFANTDWPYGNIRFWRKHLDAYDKDAAYGHDGRWRWMLYDTDHGFNLFTNQHEGYPYKLGATHNTIDWLLKAGQDDKEYMKESTFLFRELMANKDFKNSFLNRMNDLINTIFQPDHVNGRIDKLSGDIAGEMPYHIERWGAIQSMDAWYGNIQGQRDFAEQRPALMRQYLMEALEIPSTIQVNVAQETDQGYVRLNTLSIKNDLVGNAGEKEWTGSYFAGIPLSVEAVAKEGYTFSHWQGNNNWGQKLDLQSEETVNLYPVFVKEK